MSARIYQQPKNALQSGRARTHAWVLEYTPTERRHADPLMGWSGSGDTKAQLRLSFPTVDAALDYCRREGIEARVISTPARTLKLQAYADNFR